MKKSLFPEKGRFYKANLHNHTVFSDGNETPEEIKEIYRKQGYQIVAYTDHDVMIPHSELTDSEFLALTGVEYEFTEEQPSFYAMYYFNSSLYMPIPEDFIKLVGVKYYLGFTEDSKITPVDNSLSLGAYSGDSVLVQAYLPYVVLCTNRRYNILSLAESGLCLGERPEAHPALLQGRLSARLFRG